MDNHLHKYYDFVNHNISATSGAHSFCGRILSRQTVTHCIETLSQDLEQSVKLCASNFVYFSIALDESTDNPDTAPLMIMLREVDED